MHAIAMSALVMLPRPRWRFTWATPRVLSFAAAEGVPGLDRPFDGTARAGGGTEESDQPPVAPDTGSSPGPSAR